MYNTNIDEREQCFENLLSSVKYCDICKRMCSRKKVLSINNGNIRSKVLFIAEAPGRLGAECTGIPLYGDKTGDNFEMLLGNIGWKRENVFITNAILCNPQDENGNNSTPTSQEIANCSYYLGMVIELINPDVVVTLGVKALEAIKHVHNHNYMLKENVAQNLYWYNRILFPLYHMSPRASIHRSLLKQRADFITLSHIVDPLKGIKHKREKIQATNSTTKKNDNKLVDMMTVILGEIRTISYFKLNKVLYLIDYSYLLQYGETISGCIYLRMQEGPWIPHLKNYINELDNSLFTTSFENKKPILHYCPGDHKNTLSQVEIDFIKSTVTKYSEYTDAQIKTAVYLTAPMKYILKQENEKRNMHKAPVLYRNRTIIDTDT